MKRVVLFLLIMNTGAFTSANASENQDKLKKEEQTPQIVATCLSHNNSGPCAGPPTFPDSCDFNENFPWCGLKEKSDQEPADSL